MKTKKLTKAGREKIAREIKALMEDMCLLSHCSIFVNGREERFPFRDTVYDDESPKMWLEEGEPEIINRKATDCCEFANDDTISICYDGGIMYSVMQGEFGWSTHDNFMERLNKIIKPYGLYLEECTSWFSTLAK